MSTDSELLEARIVIEQGLMRVNSSPLTFRVQAHEIVTKLDELGLIGGAK